MIMKNSINQETSQIVMLAPSELQSDNSHCYVVSHNSPDTYVCFVRRILYKLFMSLSCLALTAYHDYWLGLSTSATGRST